MLEGEGSVGVEGLVLQIQRYSIHDGPGIRTNVYLKGCTLQCAWCSNPESQSPSSEVMWFKARCIDCDACIAACLPQAIAKSADGDKIILRELCTGCGACVAVCPSGAMKRYGVRMTVEDVLAEVERDREFYRQSGGGVTITGGEPTFQAEFTAELLKACQERGLHTAIETCGYANWKQIARVLPYTDLVLYDIKHIDSAKHRRFTGKPNDVILENARRISDSGTPIVIRVPVVRGFNDSEDALQAIADFAIELRTVVEINFLPFHQLGKTKYERLDRYYTFQSVAELDARELKEILVSVDCHGIRAEVGG